MKGDSLKSAAKEFFIDAWLEFNSEQIIDTLRKLLAGVSPDDLKRFIAEGIALPVPPQVFNSLKGYEDYLEKITPNDIFEWLYKARPDLGDVLISLGEDATAEYLVKLKGFIRDSTTNPPSPAEAEKPAQEAKPQFVMAHCDGCGKEWPVPKALADQIKVCPFCGKDREEETDSG